MKSQSRLNFEVFMRTIKHTPISLEINERNQYVDRATQIAQIVWNYKDTQKKHLRRELEIYKQMVRHYEQQIALTGQLDNANNKALKDAMVQALGAVKIDETEIKRKPSFISRFFGDSK